VEDVAAGRPPAGAAVVHFVLQIPVRPLRPTRAPGERRRQGNHAAVIAPLDLAISIAVHLQARAHELPEIHRRLIGVRAVVEHPVKRVVVGAPSLGHAIRPVNHQRKRRDRTRQQIDAGPSRRKGQGQPLGATAAAILILGKRDRVRAEVRPS
jgi:hypothetical protein